MLNSSPKNLKTLAMEYLDRGLSIIPLKPRDKRPLLASWAEYQKRPPTKSEADIWWTKNPTANIAIVTGAVSGVIALDIDGPEGRANLGGRHLPLTWTATTGKGYHYFFRHPGGTVKNAVGLEPGLDFRGDGGYVVAAGSVHPSGRIYEWMAGMSPDEVDLAEAPTWLMEKLTSNQPAAGGKVTPEDWEANVTQGKRNNEITRRAGSLLARGLPVTEVIETLLLWNQRHCSPPLAEDEVRRTVISVANREKRKPRPKQASPDAKETYNLTDMGNAKRLVARHGHDLRYCHPWSKWLVWNGRRWIKDATAEVIRRAKDTVTQIYAETAQAFDDEARKAIARHAIRSESEARIKSMINLAESELPVLPEDLDADKWLLNCANGTLDLRTRELRPHQREDLITKIIDVEYDPNAKCPTWLAFLDRIMAGNVDLIYFLQRSVGYTLTGNTSEQCLFFLHGCGANGKSTLINTIGKLMGDYGLQTPTETLMVKKGDGVNNDIARLKGARFVSAVETEEGRRLAEVLVKQLTGGDIITARFLHAEFFEFRPTFKLWLAANHKPVIRGTDNAIWRRIRLIPFNVTIPEAERDKELPEKLKTELPGILAWAVEGCVAWQVEGLDPPDEVRLATQGYREEMDVLAGFLAECCVVAEYRKAAASDLYAAYVKWCEANGERIQSQRAFGMRLTERGFVRLRGTAGRHVWEGLGLVDHDREEPVRKEGE